MKEVLSWKAGDLRFAILVGVFSADPNMFVNRHFLPDFQAESSAELASNARSVYRQHYDALEARVVAEGRPVLGMRLKDGWDAGVSRQGKTARISGWSTSHRQ